MSGGRGERVVITGATGFVGRQVVRLLLERHPEARLVLFVRARGTQPGSDRARTIIREVTGERNPEVLGDRVTVQASPYISRFVRLQDRTYFYRTLLDRLG